MSNETDATKRPQTQLEEPSESSSTHTVTAMDVADENADDGATRPISADNLQPLPSSDYRSLRKHQTSR
jgi:hypothetical protein